MRLFLAIFDERSLIASISDAADLIRSVGKILNEIISRGGGGVCGLQSVSLLAVSIIKYCQGVARIVTTFPRTHYLPDDY